MDVSTKGDTGKGDSHLLWKLMMFSYSWRVVGKEDYSGQEITIEQSFLNFHSRQELEDDDA